MDASTPIAAARDEVVGALSELLTAAVECELPSPPEALAAGRDHLAAGEYSVLVVGEASKGKSSFVNALIGRDLLPTDVDVATSQVFRIARGESEAYRLRFEDESAEPIEGSDLSQYGSQIVADEQGAVKLDRTIRWIEVDVPVKFLPQGVNLLDTPGLGALYAAHAEITHRFLPHADAVIMVLDSERPISEEELTFIEKLLAVTSSLFFIQTKIDLFRQSEWKEIAQRNAEILRQRFGNGLPDARVWPISSTNLKKAAETGDEDYELVSRHRELAVALKNFLFRVAGVVRAAELLVAADQYQKKSSQILGGRLKAAEQDLQKDRAAVQATIAAQKKQFQAEWGERGGKRQEAVSEVKKALAIARTCMSQALQPGGAVENEMQRQIDELKNIAGAKKLADRLAADAVDAAARHWKDYREQAERRCVELLAPFLAEAEKLLLTEEQDQLMAADEMSLKKPVIEDTLFAKLKAARGESMTITMLGGVATAVLAVFAAPVVVLIAAAASVGGLILGLSGAPAQQLKSAQQDLQRYLGDVLKKLRAAFLTIDPATGQNLVDRTLAGMETAVLEHLKSVAAKRLAEAQQEIDRLEAESKMNEDERREQAKKLREQLARWQTIGRSLRAAGARLSALDQELLPAAAK